MPLIEGGLHRLFDWNGWFRRLDRGKQERLRFREQLLQGAKSAGQEPARLLGWFRTNRNRRFCLPGLWLGPLNKWRELPAMRLGPCGDRSRRIGEPVIDPISKGMKCT